MIMHHVGSANEIVGASATRYRPFRCRAQPDGRGWTYFGDESNAVFAASKAKEAAFKWIAFLSTAENNIELNKLTGQLPIATSAAANWTGHPKRVRRGERRVAADRRLTAGSPEDAGLHRPDLANQHAARIERGNFARRHDEGYRAAFPRMSAETCIPAHQRRRAPPSLHG